MEQQYIKMPVVLLLALLFTSLSGYTQLNLPDRRHKAGVYQRIGLTDIEITYSRPPVIWREIYGNLVPYGMNNLGFGTVQESPWRAGTDENTVIHLSHDVTV